MRVAIIGAGIIGQAVGHELASRGAGVQILDPRGTGRGATAASAGMLAPHIEGHSPLLRTLTLCSYRGYDAFVARVAADAAQSIEYRRCGTLQVARDDREAAELAEASARLSAGGVPHELLDGSGARRSEPALTADVTAALRVPSHGYVSVPQLMTALAAAAARRGCHTAEAAVDRIDRDGHSLRVATSAGSFDADAVVIAAGSWSGAIASPGVPAAPVRPIRGQLVQLQCAVPPVSQVIWGTGCYLVPWTDGTVLVGATVEDVGFDEQSTPDAVRGLQARARALVPPLADARFVAVRVGLRPATPDELPVIGASSRMRGMYYATGHYRNGILLAPLTASLVADLVLDGRERPDLAFVRPDRFGL